MENVEEHSSNATIDTENNVLDDIKKTDFTTESISNKVEDLKDVNEKSDDVEEMDSSEVNDSKDKGPEEMDSSGIKNLYDISEDVDSTMANASEDDDDNDGDADDDDDGESSDDIGQAPQRHDSDEDSAGINFDRPPKRPGEVITIDLDSSDSSVCHVESYIASASEAKRLRKGRSPTPTDSSFESEESEDYDDDSIISDEAESVIAGPSILSKCVKQLRRKSVDAKDFDLNDCFCQPETEEQFLSHWSNNEPYKSTNLTLHNHPFQICILDNFLSNPDTIDCVVDDMNTLDWSRRIMDLYEFHRTVDLKNLTWQRSIKWIYELLQNSVMEWVAKVTNMELTHISASCALYGPGDHLLVHDDMLDDRKIAFIFYMAPWDITVDDDESSEKVGWKKSMGGELEFFAVDELNQPSFPVESLVPKNNTFAFFKVGSKSFHQVSEVLSFDYPRLTINGWFHGPLPSNQEANVEPEYCENVEVLPPNNDILQNDLSDWITPIYLTPKCKNQIVPRFEDTSEISLENFFLETKYNDLLEILQRDDLDWEKRGPLNLRNYEILPLNHLDKNDSHQLLNDFTKLLSCKHFVNLLSDYVAQSKLNLKAFCKLEIQKWTAGCYTVLPLKGDYIVSEIDVAIYLGCPDRLVKGGTITYILPEEPDADPAISVFLKNNALNIVHCETGFAKFTKYISKLSFKEDETFYILACSYRDTSAK